MYYYLTEEINKCYIIGVHGAMKISGLLKGCFYLPLISFPLSSLLLFLYGELDVFEEIEKGYISLCFISVTSSQMITHNTTSHPFISAHWFSTI